MALIGASCRRCAPLCVARSLARALERLQHLEELKLANAGIDAVPDALWMLPALCSLDLTGNRLGSLAIPPGAGPRLEMLSLRDNSSLASLSMGTGALPRLRVLDIR